MPFFCIFVHILYIRRNFSGLNHLSSRHSVGTSLLSINIIVGHLFLCNDVSFNSCCYGHSSLLSSQSVPVKQCLWCIFSMDTPLILWYSCWLDCISWRHRCLSWFQQTCLPYSLRKPSTGVRDSLSNTVLPSCPTKFQPAVLTSDSKFGIRSYRCWTPFPADPSKQAIWRLRFAILGLEGKSRLSTRYYFLLSK